MTEPVRRELRAAYRARRLRARQLRALAGLVGLAVVVWVVLVVVLPGGGAVPTARGGTPDPGHGTAKAPRLAITATVPGVLEVSGSLGDLPFPKSGQGAVGVAGVGIIGASPHEISRPIASVTKVMTAFLVLRDHPLTAAGGGPVLTMTKADHLAWIKASEEDESNVRIVAGERIDERQLLEALLIPSADNVADILARWDAGSIVAFAQKMNAEAALLGLGHTRYGDASGVNPLSRSTAANQVVLAAQVMANPVFRSIVDMRSAVIPVAGRVWNYNPVLGQDGIVGVKSGFTQEAEGCLVTAAWRTVSGHRVLVVSAATGQTLGLYEAGRVDVALLDAATGLLAERTVLGAGDVVGVARDRLTGKTAKLVLSGGGIVVTGWPGLGLRTRLRALPRAQIPARALAAGTIVATLRVTAPSGSAIVEPVVLARELPASR
ncbi:MAG: D-alanyl-D-alanine carboxypeptidase family protein [Acidimicrobiales bacterium]